MVFVLCICRIPLRCNVVRDLIYYNLSKSVMVVCMSNIFPLHRHKKNKKHKQLLFNFCTFSTCLYFNSNLMLSDAVVTAASITLIDNSGSNSQLFGSQGMSFRVNFRCVKWGTLEGHRFSANFNYGKNSRRICVANVFLFCNKLCLCYKLWKLISLSQRWWLYHSVWNRIEKLLILTQFVSSCAAERKKTKKKVTYVLTLP